MKTKIIAGFVLFFIGLMIATYITTSSTWCTVETATGYQTCSMKPSACPQAGIFYIISGIGIGLALWGILSSYTITKKK